VCVCVLHVCVCVWNGAEKCMRTRWRRNDGECQSVNWILGVRRSPHSCALWLPYVTSFLFSALSFIHTTTPCTHIHTKNGGKKSFTITSPIPVHFTERLIYIANSEYRSITRTHISHSLSSYTSYIIHTHHITSHHTHTYPGRENRERVLVEAVEEHTFADLGLLRRSDQRQ
jgi:hypothetical protein